ncbi:MAG: YdcF family protein [Lachnospiraceae bacterium]|nr:YdcF family protein [Lachnospiraceae bacterium]
MHWNVSLFGICRMTVYILLGILLIRYGRFVDMAATGTGFYRVWILMGIVLFMLAACVPFRVWHRLPKGLKIGTLSVLALGLIVFLSVEIMILRHFHDDAGEVDYLLVLGAQVYEDRPSLVLKYRLDRAVTYLSEHPNTICIVTGGQGVNEPHAEAVGMYRYLTEQGIDGSRILLETESTNTTTNMEYSMKLIPDKNARIGILSNNFHIFRAVRLARKQGMTQAVGIAAPSKKEYLPTNMLREFCGVLKDFLLGNM